MRFIHTLFAVLFIGCGLLSSDGPSEVLPEKRNTLAALGGRYLLTIRDGDLQTMTRMVLWDQYLENNEISAAHYSRVWTRIQKKWALGAHPLRGLKVQDVLSTGDKAKLVLIKDPELGKQPDPQEVEVSFDWTGGGWMISGDNLFSKDGYFTKIIDVKDGA